MPVLNAALVSAIVLPVQSPFRLGSAARLQSSTHFLGEREPVVARCHRTILVQTPAAVERQTLLNNHRTAQYIADIAKIIERKLYGVNRPIALPLSFFRS